MKFNFVILYLLLLIYKCFYEILTRMGRVKVYVCIIFSLADIDRIKKADRSLESGFENIDIGFSRINLLSLASNILIRLLPIFRLMII